MSSPSISVIMATYKEPLDFVRDAVYSILNQSFTDFDFLIVIDLIENKPVVDFLESIDDMRLKLLYNEKNIGLPASLNKAINLSFSKYIVRMDADDISLENRLEMQYNYMESHPECIVCGSRILPIKGFDNLRHDWVKKNHQDNFKQLFIGTCFVHPSVIIRKDVIENHDLFYNENYKYSQDYEFWSRLVDYGEFHNMYDRLLLYRFKSPDQNSAKFIQQMEFAKTIRRNLIKRYYSISDFDGKVNTIFRLRSNTYIEKEVLYLMWCSIDNFSYFNLLKLFYFQLRYRCYFPIIDYSRLLLRLSGIKKMPNLI